MKHGFKISGFFFPLGFVEAQAILYKLFLIF